MISECLTFRNHPALLGKIQLDHDDLFYMFIPFLYVVGFDLLKFCLGFFSCVSERYWFAVFFSVNVIICFQHDSNAGIRQ